MPDLRPLLSPDSVAIIGAAADSSLRGRLTHQLVEHGFDGRIYPVTRSQKEVLGHKAYAAIADIPEAADLAVILVPAAHVVATIEQCAARGIPAAVVISSGYLSDEMRAAAMRAGVRGLLQKEYSLEQLAVLVHTVLTEDRERGKRVEV